MAVTDYFQPPDTTILEKTAFLVGTPIAHSSSPALHRAIYSSHGEKKWAQVLCETDDLSGFVQYLRSEPKAMGSGVTMPFKVAVLPHLDELTPEGEAIGACNTIFFKEEIQCSRAHLRNGTDGVNGVNGHHSCRRRRLLCGTNTDCLGIRDAFFLNVKQLSSDGLWAYGKPGLVVGGGGTCRAALYSLRTYLGCSPIYIINRDKHEVDAVLRECEQRGRPTADIIYVETVEQAAAMIPPTAIVSAIPDFTPVTDDEHRVREILKIFLSTEEKGAILEMCYHPNPVTQIFSLAASFGWQVISGTEAMVGQGLAQANLWTGIKIDDTLRDEARALIQQINEQKHQAKVEKLLSVTVTAA